MPLEIAHEHNGRYIVIHHPCKMLSIYQKIHNLQTLRSGGVLRGGDIVCYIVYVVRTYKEVIMEFLRINEAAERLGVSRTVIYRLIGYGALTKYEVLGVPVINAAELNKPNVANRKAGRPPIKEGSVK